MLAEDPLGQEQMLKRGERTAKLEISVDVLVMDP
jgi:hypothetical protein